MLLEFSVVNKEWESVDTQRQIIALCKDLSLPMASIQSDKNTSSRPEGGRSG